MKSNINQSVPMSRSGHLHPPGFLLMLASLVFSAGCASKVSRLEHARAFPGQLSEKTARTLPDRPIALGECIDIALANNLNLQALEIEKRLASLDRKIAFGGFLPNIGL